MAALPQRLEPDALVEALCEFQFDSEESRSLPEAVIGRLVECPLWRGYERTRLPIADMPAEIRKRQPELRNQAILELRGTDIGRVVKIGTNVLSYHTNEPYPGWDKFSKEIEGVSEFLLTNFEGIEVQRLGFRYINLLTEKSHNVSGIDDLNVSIKVARNSVNSKVNLNYVQTASDDLAAMIRIATPDFVKTSVNRDFQVLVDIDVHTPENSCSLRNHSEVTSWIDRAHKLEKEQFFSLIPERIIKNLDSGD